MVLIEYFHLSNSGMSTFRYVARLFRRPSSCGVTSVFFATHCNLQHFFGKKWLQASSWLQAKFCPKQHLSARCPRPRVVAKAVLKHTKRTWDWKVGQWRTTPWRKLVHRVKLGANSRGKCEQGRWKPGWNSNREHLLTQAWVKAKTTIECFVLRVKPLATSIF